MFELNLSIAGNKQGSIKLPAFAKKMIPNLKRGIDKSTLQLEGFIKAKQLSGQALNVRSGRLWSSFTRVLAKVGATGNVWGEMGTNVVYAAIHEYGSQDIVDVKAHSRRAGPVRAHKRQMNIKAKYYMRYTLEQNYPAIEGYIAREIIKPLL